MLLKLSIRSFNQMCGSKVAQKCRPEVLVRKVDLKKRRSEVLLRSVDQKKCGSEVLVRCRSKVSLKSVNQKCCSEKSIRKSVAQKCRSEKLWFRSVDQVSLKSVAHRKCGSALRILLLYSILTQTTAREIRHARSSQRVRRPACKFARRHSESGPTRTIPAEGSSASVQIRKAPQRERSDTHDPRRGFIGQRANSHGAAARAIRHARSPQRVRRPACKFARRHSEIAPTRTIYSQRVHPASARQTHPRLRKKIDFTGCKLGLGKLGCVSQAA